MIYFEKFTDTIFLADTLTKGDLILDRAIYYGDTFKMLDEEVKVLLDAVEMLIKKELQ